MMISIQKYLIFFFGFCCYNKCVLQNTVIATKKKSSVKKSRFKSPTKTNTDYHNGEVKQNIFNKASKFLLILKNVCKYMTEIKSNCDV